MPFEGHLRDDALEQLFKFISLAHKTGALTLEDDDARAARLYFKRGKLIYAALDGHSPCLTDVLVRVGKLNADQAKFVRARSKTGTDQELGLLMLQQGMLTRTDIIQGARDFLVDSVNRLSTWRVGRFRFDEGFSPPEERVAISVRLDQLIFSSSPHAQQRPGLPIDASSERALKHPSEKILHPNQLGVILRRLGTSLGTLLVIAYVTLFGLIMAERGQSGLPADPPSAAVDAFGRTLGFLFAHPGTYYWHKDNIPALLLVAEALLNSAGLLIAALGLAVVIGVPLGIAMAFWRRLRGTTVVLLLSVLAISTPSFLLGMLLWIINIEFYRQFGTAPLPAAGFGWDTHMVMPMLVLAARPLAQIVQVSYVAMTDVFDKDYIRTANGKGLPPRWVVVRHALRNALIPILTTLGTSLRFSLSSLPVVEFFFAWPGIGLLLLQAIDARNASLVTDLILSLGLLFLITNLVLEFAYQLIDPRLRGAAGIESREIERVSWRARLKDMANELSHWGKGLLTARRHTRRARQLAAPRYIVESKSSSSRRLIRSTLRNPAFVIGFGLVLVFCVLAIFGQQLAPANPYVTHGLTKVDGELQVPPFKPSGTFPWGGDPVGRDIQALVLAGTKQTLALALFGMFSRVVVGTVLGMIAAWTRGSRFDQFVVGAVGVWAAFPATLFAMILILALGIKQGMWVFVVAICVVGWGEIAQTVRGQVIALKTQQFIEGARSLGARGHEILIRHILPNLMPSLIVLAVLELGGILMLLAELGFLNIFLGGGFQVEIGSGPQMTPIIYYFSDVPEWGALLANIRNWWRSYPWLAWYPGLFFFAAILAFNLFGAGLRRFFEESRVNVSRVFNRFTLGLGGAAVIGLIWVLQTNAPLSLYKPQAQQFDPQRALQDIHVLSSPEFQGREPGTLGAKRAAEYIAARMKEIGLNPGNDDGTYILTTPCPVFHLAAIPQLEIVDPISNTVEKMVYRQDMVEYIGSTRTDGEAAGKIVGVAIGMDPAVTTTAPRDTTQAPILGGTNRDPYGLGRLDLRDKVIIVHESRMLNVNPSVAAGVLVIADDPMTFERRYLYHKGQLGLGTSRSSPVLYVTPLLADRLLRSAGSSLAGFGRIESGLQAGTTALTGVGANVRLSVTGAPENLAETCYNVVGHIPGSAPIEGLDSQVIMVSAPYEGVGIGPDGEFYSGANDNASGVAEMLEIAHVMKQSIYQPKKSLVFVAWTGGERLEGFSVWNIMNATRGLNQLTVETVIELSGVGAGDGSEIAIGQGSSFRLTQLFQDAAGQLGSSITTRGRSPHFGLPVTAGFGGRTALSAYVSWDGSNRSAHTVHDTFETINAEKLKKTGETTTLVLSVLSRETEY